MFEETTDIDAPDHEEVQAAARRMQAYSAAALRAAAAVDKTFVKHGRFQLGVSALDRCFQLSREVDMPHGVRLIGPPGSGKTALFRFFRETLPRSSLFTPGFGAIGIRAGRRPTAGQLVGALLRAYRYPFKGGGGATVYARRDIAFDLVIEKGTRLVFVDEAHHLVQQMGKRDHRDEEPEPTDLLREMLDTTGTSLVLAGTDKLDALKDVDPALYDRVPGRLELAHFPFDDTWRGLIRAWIKGCTVFDLTPISNEEDFLLLHKATGGSMRRLKRLLTEGVLIAVDAGKRSLDRESLAKANLVIAGAHSLERNPYAG